MEAFVVDSVVVDSFVVESLLWDTCCVSVLEAFVVES